MVERLSISGTQAEISPNKDNKLNVSSHAIAILQKKNTTEYPSPFIEKKLHLASLNSLSFGIHLSRSQLHCRLECLITANEHEFQSLSIEESEFHHPPKIWIRSPYRRKSRPN